MGRQLERTDRKSKGRCCLDDLRDRSTAGKSYVCDADLYELDVCWMLERLEPVISKE